MKKKDTTYPQSAGKVLTYRILKKADMAFSRQRRTMEDKYGMPHGTFTMS